MKLHDFFEELEDEKDDPHGSFYDNGNGQIRVVRLAYIKGVNMLPPSLTTADDVNSYSAQSMGLTNLKGAPHVIKGDAWFGANHLKNLSGTLHEVHGDLNLNRNSLTSLEGDVHSIDTLNASYNNLKSLKGIHKVFKHVSHLIVDHNPIKSHVLGVLLIPGLEDVVFNIDGFQEDPLYKAEKIINRYLPNTHGMAAVLECQDEMIDVGLEELAQL